VRKEISKDEINALPIRRYEGEVCLVASPEELQRAMADIRHPGGPDSVIGFDTETRPAFKPGESYLPCLAQLATARAVYLFQLQRQDFAAPIAQILSSEKIVKAGVALPDDLRQLKKMFPFEERSVVDLGALARRHGFKQSGVRGLAALVLGFRIPKGTKTSNWSAPRLSPQQIAYAATDAWACRELYLSFHDKGLL
jgi:ribonuclease D